MFRQRSSLPGPGSSSRSGEPAKATDRARTEPHEATGDAFHAHLSQAQTHANLGMPVDASERFRLAKRVVYRVGWLFLHHQVAFNHAMMEADRELAQETARLTERTNRLQERLESVSEQIERDLRDDLLDFADRSASQAHAEVSDHVAEARGFHADLILELRTLQAELNAAVETLAHTLQRDGGPTGIEGRREDNEMDGDAHEGMQ